MVLALIVNETDMIGRSLIPQGLPLGINNLPVSLREDAKRADIIAIYRKNGEYQIIKDRTRTADRYFNQ